MAKKRRFCVELVREVFRLKWTERRSNRFIGKALNISKSTVGTYLARAKRANINCLLQINSLSDEQLKKIIFPHKGVGAHPSIDFKKIHKEMKRKNVTLMLLWQEQLEDNPELYSYNHFCLLYRQWKSEQKISMKQIHKAGEKAFIDYAGTTVPIHNHKTGEVTEAQVFVTVLGASDYAYVEASWSQGTKDFLRSNINAFEYFGGVSEVWVPDNLKSAVNIASRYEPEINQSYRQLAEHYRAVIIPARAYRPKDKAKAENGVLNVSRWILARLRDRKFFSLEELNEAIWEQLEDYNNKKMQGLSSSRSSLFEEVEKDALKPLPEKKFELASWKKVKANIDYHIVLEKCFYSVPYKMRGKSLQARYTDSLVEIFYQNKRVASHRRLFKEKSISTTKEHMPVGHREYSEWSPSRIINWARKAGPCCALICERIMNTREHPELGYRSCLGILRLEKKYSSERLENACRRALKIGGLSFKSIDSILSKGLDHQEIEKEASGQEIDHENIRGSSYYQ